MQSFRKCIWSLTSNYKSIINNVILSRPSVLSSGIHTTPLRLEEDPEPIRGIKAWYEHNKVVFPPLQPGEKPRHAFVCHAKENIKYSPKKMWYLAAMVRGLTVDEAVKQLSFCSRKGAIAIKETILEAQQLAVEKHNVEFKSNLWVSESFAGKAKFIKGIRRHAKGRQGTIHYRYVNYFVKLEEGKPPKHYYLPLPQTKEDLLNDWLVHMRRRKVSNTL